MKNLKITYKCRFLFWFLLFIVVITACEQTEKTEILRESKQEQPSPDESAPPADDQKAMLVPIKDINGEFQGANGWLSNEKIVYTVNAGTGSSVYIYDLFSGSQSLFYKSSAPIVAVTVSPNGKYVLIRSSPGTYESNLTVVKENGEAVLDKSLSAFDLAVEWNPYKEESLFVSSFTEDWDFTSYHLDIKTGNLEEIEIKEPFAKWADENNLLYLAWDSDNPSLFAPMIKRQISGDNETEILENIFQFDSEKNRVMTITVSSDEPDQAVYTFMDNRFQKQSVLAVPHLTRFSDWLVPYYDWAGDQFITFQPLYSADSDTYAGDFQLISFNTNEGVKDILIEGMENTPISCSPNGKTCLAGFYLEEVIMLDSKDKVPLLENEQI
ncbi:hypothetical protein [Cytobacillus sp. NCCP-133]|uniref:YqgU-like beta propeller domain-containing protein n=1 Tax=Cytobacillus sp. NCCP-133 TaxID=766848 RepID=UPI0022304F81|nr:hypothetical protein [Cytobacillus sp. NCCP-133]GLB58189.1 hypothetical protein NCCP133_03220 [Cytobacillus sp. NCCP-133]